MIEACSAPRDGQTGTWITPEMVEAYTRLHELGHAHSVESWQDGELVGGLYGVALGRVFFGESMFTRAPDASKVALAALVGRLQAQGYRVIDCQQDHRAPGLAGRARDPTRAFAQLLQDVGKLSPHRGERWSLTPNAWRN